MVYCPEVYHWVVEKGKEDRRLCRRRRCPGGCPGRCPWVARAVEWLTVYDHGRPLRLGLDR